MNRTFGIFEPLGTIIPFRSERTDEERFKELVDSMRELADREGEILEERDYYNKSDELRKIQFKEWDEELETIYKEYKKYYSRYLKYLKMNESTKHMGTVGIKEHMQLNGVYISPSKFSDVKV